MENSKVRDSSGKIIFNDPNLCAQFLRDYTDIPILKNIKPEDIENMTNRYVRIFTEERDSDVVNKVHLRDEAGNDRPFYLVSLIEHKSTVDYNVIMQILRYIVYIWEDYEKEQNRRYERKKRKKQNTNQGKDYVKISSQKDFKYPPILPIIFYAGTDKWTAATELKDRVYLSDLLGEYIPNYKCLLVNVQKYSVSEIKKKNDELSLVMLINRLSKASDFAGLSKNVGKDFIDSVTKDTPESLLETISQVIEALLLKINVPQDEVDDFVDNVKEQKMGRLFDHFEDYDVQATRAEARATATLETRNADIHRLAQYNMSRDSNLTEAEAIAQATAILS